MIRNICLCIVLIPVLMLSCIGPPEADFYEHEGMVSIETSQLNSSGSWVEQDLGLLTSLVYLDHNSGNQHNADLEFSFYLQTPGAYYLSVLTAYLNPQKEGILSIRVTDAEGTLAGNVMMIPPFADFPAWISMDRDGNEAVISLENPGLYTIRIQHPAYPGLVVDKVHLTLNNEYPPCGIGYPATDDPGTDPLFAKREQSVGIPPSSAFGVIADIGVFRTIAGNMPDISLSDVLISYPDSGRNGHQLLNELAENFEESREGENDRGFVIQRAASIQVPGFKRYPAMFYPEGNNGFAELQRQVRLLTDPALSSYEIPFFVPVPEWMGSDHETGSGRNSVSGELLMRWVQLGMLSPVMVLPFSDAGQIQALSELEREQIRAAIQFRRNLFPYLYSYTLRARTSGERTVTAVDNMSGALNYGNELFAVPVTEEELTQMPVRFPEGDWYSWWDGEKFAGGQTWLIDLTSGRLPFFVKAGSIIPQRSGGMPVDSGSNDSLVVDIFSGGVSSFRLYEDDGTTMDYLDGEFTTTAFRWFEQEGEATFTIGAMVWGNGDDYRTQTQYALRFRYMDLPESVTVNGEIAVMGTGNGEWWYDESERSVIMRLNQPSSQKTDIHFEW